MNVTSDRIRNIALVGHHGNGKTSLAEAMLCAAGLLGRPGTVEAGTTVLDRTNEERERTQSVQLGVASFDWGDHRINLIDAPGYTDFVGDALAALRAADAAVFVIDATNGVQVNDELLWRTASDASMPRLVFVNKMDKERASFDATLAQLRDRFGTGVKLVELPVGEQSAFSGVADLLTEHVFFYQGGTGTESDELPTSIEAREHDEHEQLVEDVVEADDDLIARYLDGEQLSIDELEGALHRGVVAGSVWPVLCGSATEHVAVDRLVEFVCHIAPSPGERPPVTVDAGGRSTEVACDPAGEPLAIAFKTTIDDYVGQVTMFRVLSGTVRADDVLVNPRTGQRERLHHVQHVVGSKHHVADTAPAGDIVGAIKLSDVATGDTLAPTDAPMTVAPLPYPQPVHGIAVAAHSTAAESKLAVALHELVAEDPTLQVTRDDETHQTVLRGNGDVHLQVALTRLQRRHGIELDTEPVKIAYREALRAPIEAEGRHKKQSGGRGQFGVATVRFEPLERGAGYEFVDDTHGGVIPRGLIPAVDTGISESMARGGRHGYPIVDVRATVLDGKHHTVDSDEMSFKMVGSLALRAAIDQVGTDLLEPIVRVEVMVPGDLQGDVMADLGGRRGHIDNTEAADEEVTVTASVPMSEMIDYAVALRSMTHGRGRFTLRFERYQECTTP